MRKIEKKIIEVMRECLDGDRGSGEYSLSKRDKVEFLRGRVRYILWGSAIFTVGQSTYSAGRSLGVEGLHVMRYTFNDGGYSTRLTYARLKTLILAFILPHNVDLCMKATWLYGKFNSGWRPLFDLSINNCLEIERPEDTRG